ncbi:Multidrug resistance protein 1 [Podila epigama]|nr:Multidrug resistance protein 1 [Podila epigama]
MNADVIYVMDKGVVLESGTHASLMAFGGTYADFVRKQQVKTGGFEGGLADEAASATLGKEHHTTPQETALDVDERIISAEESTLSQTPVSVNDKGEKATMSADDEPDMFQEKKDAKRRLKAQKAPILRTMGYLRPDISLCVLGAFLAMVQGVVFPILSQVMSGAISTLFKYQDPTFDYAGRTNHYALMFVAVAAAAFVSYFGGMASWYIVGERVTRKMRHLSYQAILRQEMAFFDRPENSTGALTSRLATDAQQMLDMVSQVILTTLSSLTTTASGLVFAFRATWEMSLIVLAAIPLLSVGNYLELAALNGFGEKTRKAYEHSGQVAGEAIANIRTVVSLGKETTFENKYRSVTRQPHQYAIRKALYASFGYALAQGVGYWAYAIGFYGGYRLVDAGIITWEQMFDCTFSILFMATSLGFIASELPKFAKGKQSAINIYELLDKQTEIDADKEGIQLDDDKAAKDAVTLDNVRFTYPTRPGVKVFDHMNLTANPSQTVALVGPSGCGKSTVIALLERWYDVNDGRVVLGDHDIRHFNLYNLRNHMALVGQEPVLFDLTIKENILYGLVDDSVHLYDSDSCMEKVVAVCQLANIHDFIMSLPDKYDTRVGDKGSQLSGGQKQRIAIARALIRDPKILLLDEATSALDSESEKLVQEALDKARHGRTTIVIAHRLSTIQDADLILVIKDGLVVEAGQHNELVALEGIYANLCKKQEL